MPDPLDRLARQLFDDDEAVIVCGRSDRWVVALRAALRKGPPFRVIHALSPQDAEAEAKRRTSAVILYEVSKNTVLTVGRAMIALRGMKLDQVIPMVALDRETLPQEGAFRELGAVHVVHRLAQGGEILRVAERFFSGRSANKVSAFDTLLKLTLETKD